MFSQLVPVSIQDASVVYSKPTGAKLGIAGWHKNIPSKRQRWLDCLNVQMGYNYIMIFSSHPCMFPPDYRGVFARLANWQAVAISPDSMRLVSVFL
jgi:hypothetical protein